MSTLARVIRNTLYLVIGRILSLLASLGVYIIIGRIIGAEGLGGFSFILAYTGSFIFLSSMGIHLYITREISRNSEHVINVLGIAVNAVLIFIPLTLTILLIIAQFVLSLERSVVIGITFGGLHLALGTLILLFNGVYQAFERMDLEMAVSISENLSSLVLSAILLRAGYGVLGLVIGFVIARCIALGVSLFLYVRQIAPLPKLALDRQTFIETVKGSSPFAINILTTTVYVQIDLLILNYIKGDAISGFYKAATSLVIPLSIIAVSINRSIFPDMARSFISSTTRLVTTVEASIRYLFMIGWPMSLGLLLLAPQIINLIYGSGFEASVICLQILAVIVPMRYVNNTMGATLTAINQQGRRAFLILLSAILNLLINLILIPSLSLIGASIATVLTEIFITIALFFSIRKWLSSIRSIRLIWRPFLCGILMGILTFLLRESNLFLTITASSLAYLGLLVLFQAFPREDAATIGVTMRKWAQNVTWLSNKS